MTLRLRFGKSDREKELEEKLAFMENREQKREAYAMQTQTPRRPPHPCEHQGHEYHPLHKTAKELMLVCVRCAEVTRLPLKAPAAPAPQPRWSPAHLV